MGEYSGVASGLMGAFGGTPRRNLQQGGYKDTPKETMGFWSWLQQQGYTSDQINEVRTNPGMMAYLYEMWQTQTTRGDNQGGGTSLPTDVETEAARRSGNAFMKKSFFDQGLGFGTPEVRVPGPTNAPGTTSISTSQQKPETLEERMERLYGKKKTVDGGSVSGGGFGAWGGTPYRDLRGPYGW